MSFATGVIGGSGTNVWKPDPTLTPGAEGDPFAPFELGLTVTLDDRSFQVAQFCRIGADGLLIDATAAIVEGVTEAPTEENFWTNKTGVDLVEGDYAFLFSTIINGAAGGGGGGSGTVLGATGQVGYFTAPTVIDGDVNLTYDGNGNLTTTTSVITPAVYTPYLDAGASPTLGIVLAGSNNNFETEISTTVTGTGLSILANKAIAGSGTAANFVESRSTTGDANTTDNAFSNASGNATWTALAKVTSVTSGVAQSIVKALADGRETSLLCQSAASTAELFIVINGDIGNTGQELVHNGTSVVYANKSLRQAAGVPSGAPAYNELPIAADTTAVTGGLYIWTGSAWLKMSTKP